MAESLSAVERFGHFPIMNGPSVPWEVMMPHEKQAWKNHGQSLETLARRGGLDCAEAWYVVSGERGVWTESAAKQARESWIKFAAETNERYGHLARRIVALERVAHAAKEFRHAADRDLTGWSLSGDVCHWDEELREALRLTEIVTDVKGNESQ